MVDAVWGRLRHRKIWRRGVADAKFTPWSRLLMLLRWGAVAAVLAVVGWGIAVEIRTSFLQSLIFSRLARSMSFAAGEGPSAAIIFPKYGPYDERLGYAELPRFTASLEADHFAIAKQARWSPQLLAFVKDGGYAVYHEKERAGLVLYDRHGRLLYRATYPERSYPDFAAIPPIVVNSLSFIEDRDLFAAGAPERNPAIDWPRFALAVAGRIAGVINHRWRAGGGSTLATQLEKFRHSPEGRTPDPAEKLRQMLTASVHAYLDGRDTLRERQNIMISYLNAEPLGSRPGYGEVIGVPEALWRWFGTDLAYADWVLTAPATTPAELARKGEIYRQVLSLLLAGRRPSYYLVADHQALARLTDRYLHLLAEAGVIDPGLRDAALHARLEFRDNLPPSTAQIDVDSKTTVQLRDRLATLLHLPDLYRLDRLDLSAWASIDTTTQRRVMDVLSRLGDPAYDHSLDLYGKQLLGSASPARIAWSVVVYERGANCNYVRVRADSLNEPFDINSGAKLQLGSTAKLRTLITYLDIVDALHTRFASLPRSQLLAIAAAAKDDPITRWAAQWMADGDDGLQAMLDAAMQRKYSAAPVTFFTGGGENSFANFDKIENHWVPTVATAFQYSVNAAFIRLMHDIRNYYIARLGINENALLSNPNDPSRQAYLDRFVAQEGRTYLYRFWKDYHGLSPDEALDKLASHTRPLASHLADIFLAIHRHADRAAMIAFLQRHMPRESFAELDDNRLWELYREFSADKFSLNDEGYIAGVHPLEIWLVGYLRHHPAATWHDVVEASPAAIRAAYVWLYRPNKTFQQNVRIKTILEQLAFEQIWQDWRRQGYPFGHLVPSLGTAIGASGDRPDALAELMGIITNDGLRLRTVDLERLDFADGTPYQTDMVAAPRPERVLAPEIARTVQRALASVVAGGTGKAVDGVYHTADGRLLPVGGKTGTGDNRYHIYGRGGYLNGERVVDRTATFVFYLGNRFYGTITAYVPGAAAAQYQFSSALAVHLLKALEPELEPLINSPLTGPAPAATALPAPTARDGLSGPAIAPD